MKIQTPIATIIMGAGLAVSFSAGATSIGSQFFPNELNQLSDNSGEKQSVDINANGFLDIGDTLRGTMDWQTLEDLTGGGVRRNLGVSGVNELTAIFETEVIKKDFVNVGADGLFGSGDDIYSYTFGAHTGFGSSFGVSDNAVVLFFEDTSPDYSRTGTVANAEATATNGNLMMGWGIGLDLDELLQATAPQSVATFKNVNPGASPGSFNFQVSILFENFAEVDFKQVNADVIPIGGDGFIDVVASGNVLGTKGIATGYQAFNNVDAVLRAVPVPEPASLAPMGIGLLGMGATSRRLSKK